MKLQIRSNILATILILMSLIFISCGKKVTNIFPGESSSGASYHGGGQSQPAPGGNGGGGGGGNGDPAGGNTIASDPAVVERILQNKTKLKKDLNAFVQSLLYQQNISIPADQKIFKFLVKLDAKNKKLPRVPRKRVSCFKETIAANQVLGFKNMHSASLEQFRYADRVCSKQFAKDSPEYTDCNIKLYATEFDKEEDQDKILSNCSDFSIQNYLKRIHFVVKKEECKKHKAASVTLSGQNLTLCLSISEISKTSPAYLHREIMGLLIHELGHLVAGTQQEDFPEYVQNFAVNHYDFLAAENEGLNAIRLNVLKFMTNFKISQKKLEDRDIQISKEEIEANKTLETSTVHFQALALVLKDLEVVRSLIINIQSYFGSNSKMRLEEDEQKLLSQALKQIDIILQVTEDYESKNLNIFIKGKKSLPLVKQSYSDEKIMAIELNSVGAIMSDLIELYKFRFSDRLKNKD